jgi:hypothetical protein
MLDEVTRVREHQVVLREVNNRIAHMDWSDAQTDTFDFLCECGASGCMATVSMTLNQFAARSERGPITHEGH